MNLHSIASPLIGAVNPHQPASVQVSTGYLTSLGGARTPQYQTYAGVTAQVQELSTADLRQLDALNIAGIRRKIYLNGQWNNLVRSQQKGGDLVTLPDGTIWLIVHVFEYWPDWCSAAITLQNGS